MLLDEMLDYRRLDITVEKKDGFHIGYNENQHKKKTTKICELRVLLRDSSTNWQVPLKNIKASNLLGMAKFAVN